MASSKKWATTISSIASFIYFIIIILQFPLFRVPCRIGICKTPLEVTCSHLIATKLIPEALVKSLLYPGFIANRLFTNKALPNFKFVEPHRSGISNLAHLASDDLQRLEVLVGSYLSLAGAFTGLIKRGKTSLFGTLLIIWGISREAILRKPDYIDPEEAVYIYPEMSVTLISALLSVRRDIRKIYRSCKGRSITKAKLA